MDTLVYTCWGMPMLFFWSFFLHIYGDGVKIYSYDS